MSIALFVAAIVSLLVFRWFLFGAAGLAGAWLAGRAPGILWPARVATTFFVAVFLLAFAFEPGNRVDGLFCMNCSTGSGLAMTLLTLPTGFCVTFQVALEAVTRYRQRRGSDTHGD